MPPYTLGATHNLSGTGQLAVASPYGVALALTGVPPGLTAEFGTPVSYFSLGELSAGNADGWLPELSLRRTRELVVYPSVGVDRIAWTFLDGITAVATELVAPIVRPAELDRNASALVLYGNLGVGGQTQQTVFTYTVPAGRRALIAAGFISVLRTTVATTPSIVVAWLHRQGAAVAATFSYDNVVGSRATATLSPGGLYLFPGEVIDCVVQNNDTGGFNNVAAGASGHLFDA